MKAMDLYFEVFASRDFDSGAEFQTRVH